MLSIDATIRTSQANIVRTAAVNGHLYIKTGRGQLLVDIPLGAAPFAAAADGVVQLTDPVSAVAAYTGTASYFELRRSNHTLILSGSVSSTAGDLVLSDTYIVVGDTVIVDTLSYVAPEA